jgi:hypothetical protein
MRKWFVFAKMSALLCAGDPIMFELSAPSAADAPIQLPPVVVKESAAAPTAKPDRLYSESEARDAIERTPGGVALVGLETIRDSLGTTFQGGA